jgi:hypothetical protein
MGITYATRGDVSASLEANETARSNRLIDRRLGSASRFVEGLCKRRFYPERLIIKDDYPSYSYADTWRYWLEGNELVSVESVVSGGTTLDPADYFLSREDARTEPPYDSLQLRIGSGSVFSAGETFQQSLVITGKGGWNDTSTAITHGTLSGAINSSVTSLVVNPSSGVFKVDVGALVLIDDEYLIIAERFMSAVSGQTLQSNVDDIKSTVVIPVGNGTLFAVDEIILIDSEMMRITVIAGNNLVVERAFNGTVLDDHTSGAQVYASRTFQAVRGAIGSTAASHSDTEPVYVHEFPEGVHELSIAEAVVLLEQNSAGYASEMGSGGSARETPKTGLDDLRQTVREAYGRISRLGAI